MNNNKKIRIGIITFHRSINYGAFLQSYALSQKLKSDFDFDVEIIDFEYFKKNLWQKLIVFKRSRIIYIYKYIRQFFAFRLSLKKLPLSKKKFVDLNAKKVIEFINKNYDYIIVGSDGVWAYNSFNLGVENIYFLKSINVKKISYAACAFGLDYNNINMNDRKYITESLDSFDYIGVRDSGTYRFAKEHCQKDNIFYNCDPTILLKKPNNDLIPNILKRYGLKMDKPIIGMMIDNDLISKRVREVYGEKYQIVSLFNHNKYADTFLYDLTPFEWSQVFQIFKLLFTSYFHGSLLCLKNEVPVIAVQGYPYNEKYISKIEQVFSDLGLQEYCFIASKIDKKELERMMVLADYTLNNEDVVLSRIVNGLAAEEKKYTSLRNYFKEIENAKKNKSNI